MDIQKYHVCFKGDVLPGHELASCKEKFQMMFKLSEEKTNAVFSGRTVVLKKNVDKETALKYQNAFKKAGIKPIFKKASPTQEIVPEAQTHEESEITCPKCETTGQTGEECQACGIIFRKYEESLLKAKQKEEIEEKVDKVLVSARQWVESGNAEEGIRLIENALGWGNNHEKLTSFLTEQKEAKDRELAEAKYAETEKLLEKAWDDGSYDEVKKLEDEITDLDLDKKQKKKKELELGPDTKLYIYNEINEEVLVTYEINDVRSGLLNGTIRPEFSYKINGMGTEEQINAALMKRYLRLKMVINPVLGMVHIFATIAALAGFIYVLPISFPWAWGYTVDMYKWLWEVTGGNIVFIVVLFLPFTKITLICALCVLCAPAALGGAIAGLGGGLIGAILGVLLYPFLPKVKKT